jgi:tRNA-splicing ligase RtcB
MFMGLLVNSDTDAHRETVRVLFFGRNSASHSGNGVTRFSCEDHVKATEGIECRKDSGVIDETPMAYKDIDAVMAAQADLVEIVHTLRQVVRVKG